MLKTVKFLIGSAGPSGFGSKSTAEQVTETCHDLRSITAIITGATSGIGAETARVLAKRGARLVLPARSLKAAEDMKARILSEFPKSEIIVMALDLSSLDSVRKFVAEFESLNLPLNLLINNAGKISYTHAISEDGIELTFATNYLGNFWAAATTCYVATHPRLVNISGKYFSDCNEASTSNLGSNLAEGCMYV
ncbi:NAD(P)-binding Rossmann-fold superfamily protein [Forsythia ovata]|uniref:NAD(P)-binding Rossmann-fold superfamily protein n=1 Tax=Forsythia ovata TaxID=205694 RepID=A0ABD1W2B0_9LAMI